MTKDQLYRHAKVWCWWKSRYLWYTGRIVIGGYEFRDICDAITIVPEDSLGELKIQK